MILQALCDYYERKAADPESGIAPEGFEWKAIPFLIVIGPEGRFVDIQDTREGEGKKNRARTFLVPKGEKRTGNVKANLLWDNAEYALGANPRGRADTQERHAAFKARLEILPAHPQRDAVLAFLSRDAFGEIQASRGTSLIWKELLEGNANITFRVDGSAHATVCDALMGSLLGTPSANSDGVRCLVTGEVAPVARIHTSISGVRGAQSSGAALVSFNLPAFTSHGRSQNHNAPVSESAAFAYTTALNHLLARDSRQKMQVGDATTVFWSGRKATDLEAALPSFFGLPVKDDPDAETRAVAALYASPYTGHLSEGDDTPFYVLGLAPNAARIAVRFWHVDTVKGLSARLRQHFDDLEIIQSPKDPGHRALMPLLCDLVLQSKVDNIPPNLAGNVVRAVLTGGTYPATLLHLAVRRIRADKEHGVTRMRAAVLKAVLNRANRFSSKPTQEITVSLDPTNTCPGYVLGRVFALLERIQLASNNYQEVNAGIRDRFYGAFSSSPMSTFPLLMKLKNHHLHKMERKGEAIQLERQLGEVLDLLPPQGPNAHLPLEEQARFAIGYYHQRQALFTKSPKTETPQA